MDFDLSVDQSALQEEARRLLDLVTEPALQNNKKTLVARLPQTPDKAP